MPSGLQKLQLLIELKNKLKLGLDNAKNQVKKATGEMQDKLNTLKMKHIEAFRAIKDEIPGVGKAMELLKNPYIAVAATVASLGFGLIKATNEAEKFSGSFRQLHMLNIEKPLKDINRLKSTIRATAFDKGFDPTDTINAFFDVQSITGKFGSEVDSIVSKQGEFARLMQANFNEWISGTAKAMANYGFGADKLDAFNKASFATFKTAKTTFDELAKVQAIYAGAAASAKQDFAAANKMFSIFTLKTKSVDEAATLTKSLFMDLTKAETIKSFKNMGIDVFDVNKRFKQADVLLLELQNKFRELGKSDAKLLNLKNQFAGSEGLIAYIQAATDKTDQLKNTFKSFDATQFALPKALEIAKSDINYINEQLENRTKVLMTQIGDKFIPIKFKFAQMLSDTMEIPEWFKTFKMSTSELLNKEKDFGASSVLKSFPGLNNIRNLPDTEFNNLLSQMNQKTDSLQSVLSQKDRFKDSGWFELLSLNKKLGFRQYYEAFGGIEALKELTKQARDERNSMSDKDIFSANNPNKPVTDPNAPISNAVQSIASGSQTKSITINIDSMIKNFNPTNQEVNGMSKDQLERFLTEMFLRVVRSAETTM